MHMRVTLRHATQASGVLWVCVVQGLLSFW
jgi:hypothetical protein